ncbi:MAG TPA: cell wall-binding repeat-containing protein [Acidimicrobiales bacterium]|nr:cell wall-binding repeat-containing protein [Acidimicrobiales bacterium]
MIGERPAATVRIVMCLSLLAGVLAVAGSPADAVVRVVRSSGDYRLGPTSNDSPARGKTGPSLAVNPANQNHVVEVHQELETEECEYNLSFDGGTAWTGGGELQAPAGYPTDLPGPCDVTSAGAGSLGQQAVAFGSGNNVYVIWASSRQVGVQGRSLLLSTSTDGGATFGTAVVAAQAGVAPAPDYTKPELVVDVRTAATNDDRLYVATRNNRTSMAMIVRSDDSGATFLAPTEASHNNPITNPPPDWNDDNTAVETPGNAYIRASEVSQPVLGAVPSHGGDRPLYVAWVAPKNSGSCPPACETLGEGSPDGYLVVARSTDLGQSWARTRAVNVRGFVSPSGSLFGGSAFPRLAAGAGGDLYMVFNQGPGIVGSNNCGVGPFPGSLTSTTTNTCPSYGFGPFQANDHFINWDNDVYFVRSIDGGATWGDLKQLNGPKKSGLAAAEVTQTRHPNIAVASDGRVDVVWHDRRHWYLNTSDRKGAVTPAGSSLSNYACVHSHSNCSEARLGDTYYARSRDRGVSFTANRRLNDRSHNNDVGYDYRFSTYWDHGPVVAQLGVERLLVADMDSRLGNADTDSQDIFLRKVELNAPDAVPVAPIGAGTAPDLSVALSLRAQPGGSEAVHGEGFTHRPWTRPVIVNEADMPSALAGGVLARANLGPVLASPQAGLPDPVESEVDRLDPVGAYIIGDTTKLSASVETELASVGVPPGQIVRIAGATPAEIGANIALNLDRRRAGDKTATPPLPAFDAVIIANPNSASAASASALAANRRLPILYVDQNAVPAATTAAIDALDVTRAIIVGSEGVVSAGVATTLSAGGGPSVSRLAGADQFATSSKVVIESINRGLPTNLVYVADGNEPMHAALLGASVARVGGLLVLSPSGSAALVESSLGNTYGLCGKVDRLLTSDLTGAATVANDPPGPSAGPSATPCTAASAEAAPETADPFPPTTTTTTTTATTTSSTEGTTATTGGGATSTTTTIPAGGPQAAGNQGYTLVAGDGGIFNFGDTSRFFGSTGGLRLNQPIVAMEHTPSSRGYWMVAADGGIFAFGDARFFGSTGGIPLAKPIVGMRSTGTGNGYWLVASDGGIFAFGDATFRGSTGAIRLNQPMVGMDRTPSGNGYWLVASDGGIFAFGDALFRGSTGGVALSRPIVGMSRTNTVSGYHLVASDGGIFAFGDAVFRGSTGAIGLASPVVGIAPTASGGGYWLCARDGGVFAFGNAQFRGSMGGVPLRQPVVGCDNPIAQP